MRRCGSDDSFANEPFFIAMERLGLVGACIHIGQPHPRRWQNPVHLWTAIHAWLRVMDRDTPTWKSTSIP